MRSKKLSRQLKKSLDCEEIETEIEAIKGWLQTKGEEPGFPGSLSKLVENFSEFLTSVESSYEQYESNLLHAQRSLELSGKEVEERNKLLRAENKKVSSLLDNMQQAVFSVQPKGVIVGPVSKYSDKVFKKTIIDQDVYEVLYSDLSKTSEEFAGLDSAMNAVFGEDSLQWGLVEDLFPRRVIRNVTAGKNEMSEQILKTAVTPIWDDQGMLEKIMYVVEDVTEVEKLEKRVAQERAQSHRNIQIIQEFIAARNQGIPAFFVKAESMYRECIASTEAEGSWAKNMNTLLQNLHTIKGNARVLGFSLISSVTHQVESGVLVSKAKVEAGSQLWDSVRMEVRSNLENIGLIFDEYRLLLRQIFGDGFAGDDAKGAAIRTHVKASLKHALREYENMVYEIAKECGKKVDFVVVGDECMIHRDQLSTLQDAVVHLLRNSLDHGLEVSAEREAQGKSSIGRVEVVCRESDHAFFLSISDDGRGIDAERIAKKAVSKGLVAADQLAAMSEKEKLDLIFIPGFSTQEQVSEISGRGIGMDVVKASVEQKLKGTLQVDTRINRGTSFMIRLPRTN